MDQAQRVTQPRQGYRMCVFTEDKILHTFSNLSQRDASQRSKVTAIIAHVLNTCQAKARLLTVGAMFSVRQHNI